MSRDEALSFFKGVDPVPNSDRERRLMERGEQTRDEQVRPDNPYDSQAIAIKGAARCWAPCPALAAFSFASFPAYVSEVNALSLPLALPIGK